MKRALALSVLVVLGAVACTENADTLTDGSGTDGRFQPTKSEDSTETPPSSKKSDTKNTVEPPKSTADAGAPKAGECSAAASASECAKCCGQKNNPLAACGCGAGSACADACGGSLCAGGTPDLACGLCLVREGCALGDGETDEAKACLEQCSGKED